MWCTEPGLKEALYILYIHPWTVSNTDNVNILCKYLTYILTDYRLILTKDTKDRPDLSSERADHSGTALARTSKNSNITDPSSRQRGRYEITNCNCLKENLKEKEKFVAGPRWAPDTKTGRLIVSRNVTLTLTLALVFDTTRIFNQFNLWKPATWVVFGRFRCYTTACWVHFHGNQQTQWLVERISIATL
jgi:hypothetical protein